MQLVKKRLVYMLTIDGLSFSNNILHLIAFTLLIHLNIVNERVMQ